MKAETMWIVKYRDGTYDHSTLSWYRKWAIENFLAGTDLNWKKDRKKYGWKVVKVKLTIEEF